MESKVGVFICNCGNSLKNIDFPWLLEKTAGLPGVAYATLNTALCSEGKLESMVGAIRERQLDRLVIAGCSPQFSQQIFARALAPAGLDPAMLGSVNLREQCSWAHSNNVSEKSLALVRMALAEMVLAKPSRTAEITVNHGVLIIGGGFSGLKAATELSRLGVRSVIVEKEAALGGQSGTSPLFGPVLRGILDGLVAETKDAGNIEVLTSSEVAALEGTAGEFRAVVTENGKSIRRRNFGAVVIAVGQKLEPAQPVSRIVAYRDQASLNPEIERRPRQVAFLVNDSDEDSRTATLSALAGALALRERGSEVCILARDIKVDSHGAEELYKQAREKGVTFIKFEGAPQVTNSDSKVKISVRDILLKGDVSLDCDLCITGGKAVPSPLLPAIPGIGIDSSPFYQPVNPHLFPTRSANKGVFVVGSCRDDLDLARASLEATEAAFRIYQMLRQDRAVATVWVDADKCRACLTCVRVCPHSAIGMEHQSGKESARISELACDVCGICVAICPAKAIRYEGHSDEQIIAKLEAMGA